MGPRSLWVRPLGFWVLGHEPLLYYAGFGCSTKVYEKGAGWESNVRKVPVWDPAVFCYPGHGTAWNWWPWELGF